MRLLLLTHVAAASAWIGCVATELVAEKRLLAPSQRLTLSMLHAHIDAWVELPLTALTLITGWALWPTGAADAPLLAMAAAGALAGVSNVLCTGAVWRRWQAARAGDDAAWVRADRSQHRWGAGVVVGLLAGLVAAALRAGAGGG